MKFSSLAIGAALLAGCASLPNPYPADVEAREVVVAEATLKENQSIEELITPIENRFDDRVLRAQDLKSNRAEYYEQHAQSQIDREAQINSALSASEYYIQAQDFEAAERASSGLYYEPMNLIQTDRLIVINAYVAHAKGEHVRAVSLLEPLWNRRLEVEIRPDTQVDDEFTSPTIPPAPKLSTQQVDALLLGSFSFQALDDYDSAIGALITRERSLVGSSRSETTRYIWQVISSLPIERRQLIFDNTVNPLLRNRIEQSLAAPLAPVAQAPQQFGQWHEAEKSLYKEAVTDLWSIDSPRNIAILLPITSKFNKAAQAVKDGINYQHLANLSLYQPQLHFYDIGDNPALATQYYNTALQSGADFIIGPLGKDYANQIGVYGNSQVATLLLGGDTQLNASTSRFSMSPEMEGARVAERAWSDGHLSAGLLVTQSNSSRRTVAAFTRTWQSLGGKISETINYSPEQFDHSVELKQLFNINQSEQRHRALSDTLGFKPKFSAYQRSDIDFILMIADTDTGRLIRPQVNFFSGSRVPVYSTSSIFNGLPDEVNNIDLDGTRFPVMPWVLKSAQVAPYAGQLNMLFALGTDAYSVAASYQKLRSNSNIAISGNTGQVTIGNYGEATYQPVWATFRQGKVVPFETLGLDIEPLSTLNDSGFDNLNVNGNYNDSTYNSQTWDQQDGARKRAQENRDKPKDRQEGLRGSR